MLEGVILFIWSWFQLIYIHEFIHTISNKFISNYLTFDNYILTRYIEMHHFIKVRLNFHSKILLNFLSKILLNYCNEHWSGEGGGSIIGNHTTFTPYRTRVHNKIYLFFEIHVIYNKNTARIFTFKYK